MRIAILFDNFGPYHLARLKAASGVCELLAVEFGGSSSEYDWNASKASGLNRKVLHQEGSSEELGTPEFTQRLERVLSDFHPEVVFVPGWGYRGALIALQWCLRQKVPAVVMSESTAWDEPRNPIKEWVKGRILSLFSAALVGGSSHRAYLEHLGFSPNRIFLGYDAVDNCFFEKETMKLGARSWNLGGDEQKTKPYFLASARFIEKKNLPRLIKAYALYRQKAISQVERRVSSVEDQNQQQSTNNEQPATPWNLILLGDGVLRPELEKLRSELGLEDSVHLPGFKQYGELPGYYAHAGAFIHASTTEQWGLVVNEAMASGLPVLVSNRCGCAVDLVKDGVNGWTFDPTDEEQIAELMPKISYNEEQRKEMGEKGREIVSEWGPDRFAAGLSMAIEAVTSNPVKAPSFFSQALLNILLLR